VGLARLTELARQLGSSPVSRPNQRILKEEFVLTKFMKWMASAALLGGLLLPVFLGRYTVGYHVGLLILIPAAATVVIFQAASMREYRWVAAFGVLACLFNPVVPLWLSTAPTLVVNALALILFALSLKLLKTPPRLSIASITDRMPGGESL
jgi:fatty-acid desaturase